MSAASWRKLGRVFRPEGQRPWLASFAQNPFAEQLEGDLYRIYFACRDAANRASIGWLELDITRPETILRIAERPLLEAGPPGGFDDAGVMMSALVRADGRRHFYYIGWNLRDSTPYHLSIGLALGDDAADPPLAVALPAAVVGRSRLDPHFTTSPCVLREGGRWRMWYLSGVGWHEGGGRTVPSYHLAYAESADGVAWRPTGDIVMPLRPGEIGLSRPAILACAKGYEMWYSYRRGDHRYRLGYARSEDGLIWRRDDAKAGLTTSPGGWDSEMIAYPHVFVHGGARYMLYCGNDYGRDGFGLAVSSLERPTGDDMAEGGAIARYGIHRQTAHADEVDRAIEQLRLVGYAVVDGGYDADALADFAAHFDAALTALYDRHGGREALARIDEHNTIRALLATDRLFLALATNPRILALSRRMMGDYVVLNQQNGIVNPPHGGRYNQAAFHRDLPFQHFTSSRPLAVNALFCIDDFTLENGATYVVPGSHKQEDFPADATIEALRVQITAPRGSFIVLDGLLYHSGASNGTDRPRRAVNHLYSVPILRPQIDLAAILGDDYTADPELRRFLGYDTRVPAGIAAYYDKRRAQLGVEAQETDA